MTIITVCLVVLTFFLSICLMGDAIERFIKIYYRRKEFEELQRNLHSAKEKFFEEIDDAKLNAILDDDGGCA